MPLYEYECCLCRVHFERRQSVHDEPVSICPDCGGAVRRVLFPVGVIFKGSGFYVTDSRRPQPVGDGNGSKTKKETETPSVTADTKPSTPSTETKEVKETSGAKA